MAVSVGEEPETVEDVYEPFLLQAGLIMRTPRGRVAAPNAYEHLGLPIPAQSLSFLSACDPGSPGGVAGKPGRGAVQDVLFAAGADEDAFHGGGPGRATKVMRRIIP